MVLYGEIWISALLPIHSCSYNFIIYCLLSDKIGRCDQSHEHFSVIYSTNKGYEKDIILPAKDSDDSDNNS